MGWNSWNTFTEIINEELILSTADTMLESGLLAAGYNYLVIDDCWSLKERDSQGHSDLLPAPSVCFTDFAGNRTAAGKLFPCLEPGAVHQKLPSISGVHPMKHEENQKRVEKSVSEQEKCWIILGKYVIIHYYVSESTHEGNRSDALPIKKESRWL